MKRILHETAAETLKQKQKLIQENENLLQTLQCESETVKWTLNMNPKLMGENDDIKKHIEDITQHWPVNLYTAIAKGYERYRFLNNIRKCLIYKKTHF